MTFQMKTRMIQKITVLAFFALVTACSTYWDEAAEPITYKCSEVVLIGRAKTLSFEELEQDNSVLGRSRYLLEIRIKRVLNGEEKRRTVNASFVAHPFVREDRDLLVVLSRVGDDYEVVTLGVWDARTRRELAKSCSN